MKRRIDEKEVPGPEEWEEKLLEIEELKNELKIRDHVIEFISDILNEKIEKNNRLVNCLKLWQTLFSKEDIYNSIKKRKMDLEELYFSF